MYSAYAPNNNVPLGTIVTKSGVLTYNNAYNETITPTTPILQFNPYMSLRSLILPVSGAQFFALFATVITSMTVQATLNSFNGKNTLTVVFESCSNIYTSLLPGQMYYTFQCVFEETSTTSKPFEVRVPIFIGQTASTFPVTLVARLQNGQTPVRLGRLLLNTGGKCGTVNEVSAQQEVSILFSISSPQSLPVTNYIPFLCPVNTVNANQIFPTVTNDIVRIKNQCGAIQFTIPCANNSNVQAIPCQIFFGGSYTSFTPT